MDKNNKEEEINRQLESAEWYIKESNRLIEKYHKAKTEHEKQKIVRQMEAMYGKMSFQIREIKKYMPPE